MDIDLSVDNSLNLADSAAREAIDVLFDSAPIWLCATMRPSAVLASSAQTNAG